MTWDKKRDEVGVFLTMLNKSDGKVFKGVSMGGKFGKYGDDKRVAHIRKNRRRPPDPWQFQRLRFSAPCDFLYDLIEKPN